MLLLISLLKKYISCQNFFNKSKYLTSNATLDIKKDITMKNNYHANKAVFKVNISYVKDRKNATSQSLLIFRSESVI